MIDSNLFGNFALTGASVTEILKKYPCLPPKVILALAVVTMLERTVTPFRLCQCGCGAPVHGKARLDSPACRKRVQRQRDAKKAGSPKQFNPVLQSEIPVTIPTVLRLAVPPSVQVTSGSDDVPRRSPPTIPVVHHDSQRRKSFVWQGQPEPDIGQSQ